MSIRLCNGGCRPIWHMCEGFNDFQNAKQQQNVVAIAGAANMLGVSPNSDNSVYSIPLEPAPSTRQGFGRVALGNTLPLPNSTFKIQVGARHITPHSSTEIKRVFGYSTLFNGMGCFDVMWSGSRTMTILLRAIRASWLSLATVKRPHFEGFDSESWLRLSL